MGKGGSRRRLYCTWTRMLGDGTNLLLAGGTATAALLLGAWWLLLLGLFLSLAFTVWKVLQTGLLFTLAEGSGMLRLDGLKGVREPELCSLMTSFCMGRSQAEQALAEAPAELRASLQPVLASLDELESGTARLVLRAQELAECLQFLERSSFEHELRRLAELAQRTADPETRRDYESVLSLQNERLQVINNLARARERTIASLLRVVALTKGLPVRVVSLRVLDTQLSEDSSADIYEAVERLEAELQASEQTLRSVETLPLAASS